MATPDIPVLAGQIVEEELSLSVEELSYACAVAPERIAELIELGLLDTSAGGGQRLGGASLRRARLALRLQRDLDINAAGVALVIELLGRIEELEARLRST